MIHFILIGKGWQWSVIRSTGSFYLRIDYKVIKFYFIYFLGATAPQWARAASFTGFLDHTQRRTTVGRTPLDEWSARRRELYLTTHNNHKRQTAMAPGGIRTHNLSRPTPLDRAATATGNVIKLLLLNYNIAALLVGRSRYRFPVVSLDFSVTHFLLTVPWPWGRLSPYWKWVPGISLGGKGDRCVRLTTYHHTVLLSRNLGALTS